MKLERTIGCDDEMTDSSKNFELSLVVKTRSMPHMEAIAEAILDKQPAYLERRLDKLQQMADDTSTGLFIHTFTN